MAEPFSSKIPDPGKTKASIQRKIDLKKSDSKRERTEQRATEKLGVIPRETLKQQRVREENERLESVRQRDWLMEHSSDPSAFEPDQSDPTLLRIAKYYGVDMEQWSDYKDKVATLHEWAAENSKTKHYVDILWALKKLESKVDMNWGDDRVKNLYRYIRLDQDQKRIMKEKELYEK